MDYFKKKLEELLDTHLMSDTKIISLNEINNFSSKYNLSWSKEYIYFLQYYGNVYIKDNYYFEDSHTPFVSKNQRYYELDGFFGLHEGRDNIEMRIADSRADLPDNLFPIAEILGGDLVCMEKKTGEIFFWYHEMEGEMFTLWRWTFTIS